MPPHEVKLCLRAATRPLCSLELTLRAKLGGADDLRRARAGSSVTPLSQLVPAPLSHPYERARAGSSFTPLILLCLCPHTPLSHSCICGRRLLCHAPHTFLSVSSCTSMCLLIERRRRHRPHTYVSSYFCLSISICVSSYSYKCV